jgi:ActR/RegA family two-component response regulator
LLKTLLLPAISAPLVRASGYTVQHASSQQAWQLLASSHPNLRVVDLQTQRGEVSPVWLQTLHTHSADMFIVVLGPACALQPPLKAQTAPATTAKPSNTG